MSDSLWAWRQLQGITKGSKQESEDSLLKMSTLGGMRLLVESSCKNWLTVKYSFVTPPHLRRTTCQGTACDDRQSVLHTWGGYNWS